MDEGLFGTAGLDAEERATLLSARRAEAGARRLLGAPAEANFNLATAENVLLYERLREVITDFRRFSLEDTKYPGRAKPGNLYTLNARAAAFLSAEYGLGEPLTADQVMGIGGVSAALESLTFALCKPGDTVIAPAPCWQGFEWCFTYRAGARLERFPVSSQPGDPFHLTLDDVKRGCERARGTAKVLVLTNPDNPLGVNYAPELLEEIYGWVLGETGMHVVSDEIYFNSQTAGAPPFKGALALKAYQRNHDRVHVVWGFAKDFGLSGFRAGFVVTRAAAVMKAVIDRRMWFLSPFTAQPIFALSNVLGRDEGRFAHELMREYRRALTEQRRATAGALDAQSIVYYPHNHAALFFWLDLRRYLRAGGEKELNARLEANGIFLLPGQTLACPEPGWFRLCYTCESAGVIVAAVEHLGNVLQNIG
jgi:aspartate/methionine/tyrosine aminotransferase